MKKSYSKSKYGFIILGIICLNLICTFLIDNQKKSPWFQSIIYPDYIKFSRILDNLEKHPQEFRSYEPEFINFLSLWPNITNKSSIESIVPRQKTEITNGNTIRSGVFLTPLNHTQATELRNININNKIKRTQVLETIIDPLQKKTRLAALSMEKNKSSDKLYQNELFTTDIRNDLERKLENRLYIIKIFVLIISIIIPVLEFGYNLGLLGHLYRYWRSCRHLVGF